MATGALGRRVPPDFEHVEKYPLTATTAPAKPVPVAIGVNWYRAFDNPVRDSAGRYWIARTADLGPIRGGHCVCLKPRGVKDPTTWWDFYDQGSEGACVGFGASRMMSLLNRKRYFARWLWDRAKERDQWPDTNPGDSEGTSVRAALDVLRRNGHVKWLSRHEPMNTDGQGSDWLQRRGLTPNIGEGVATNRWATRTDQVLDALGYADLDYVDLLQSWGRSYPHITRMPATVIDRLLREDGEFTLVVDR